MVTKSWRFPKSDQNLKILNHVFKTSKKTLSYSRTYCKIYKIENIGKIGQSASSILAKRVIYYGSTRSTLTPLDLKNGPLIFLDESSIPEKIEIITFEAFWAKIVKNDHFHSFLDLPSISWFVDMENSKVQSQKVQKCQKSLILKHFHYFPYLSLYEFTRNVNFDPPP